MATAREMNRLLTLINEAMPEPEKIINVHETPAQNSVTFDWRGLTFTVSTSLNVTESAVHATTCHSLLMQALLRETKANH